MFRGRWMGFLIAVFALAGLLASGCSDDASRPSDTTGTPNINDEVGGYTAQNEQPAFGDATLQASGDAESPQDDPMSQDPQVQSLMRADSTHVYAVTMLWGMLSGDPSVGSIDDPNGTPVDWSGSVTLNHGALILSSTIAFEPNDYLDIRQRTDPTSIAWVSHTTTSFDGIRVVVYQPFVDGQDGSADTMTVVAGTNKWEFPVNDLADLENTYSIDENGNKFFIRSIAVSPRLSSRGFLGGAWLAPANAGDIGTFRGRWITGDGRLAGFVKGYFGTNARAEQVFFGKYIDESGTFRGFLRGHWGETGLEDMSRIPRTYGWFRGEWLDASRTRIGTIRGLWRSSRGGSDGVFEGVWVTGVTP